MPTPAFTSVRPYLCASAIAVLAAAAACGSDSSTAGTGPMGRVAIGVNPLSLPGIGDVCYNVKVTDSAGAEQWSANGICSSAYGNGGGGDIAYIGPCDASANPTTVSLVLDKLVDSSGMVIGGYTNPCPAGAPCSLTAECAENADTAVEFNLTVLRDANLGFFDISVNFEDVFCSAKFDCADEQGAPLLLLDSAGNERVPTGVLAVACSAGEGQDVSLAMSPLELVCHDANGGTVVAASLDPAAGPGNLFPPGMGPTGLRQAVAYQTQSPAGVAAPWLSWSVAFEMSWDALAANGLTDCRVRARAVPQATDTPLGFGDLPAGTPYIAWDVPLSPPSAAPAMCGRNALGADGSGVQVHYTGVDTAMLPTAP